MDDQADIGFAGTDRGKDLVEGNDEVVEAGGSFAEPKLERQERAGHETRYSNFLSTNFLAGKRLFCDQHRTVAIAHAGAAGEQSILIAHIRIGVDADG